MDQLLALLQSTLDPNPNARLQAELQLAQLSTQSGPSRSQLFSSLRSQTPALTHRNRSCPRPHYHRSFPRATHPSDKSTASSRRRFLAGDAFDGHPAYRTLLGNSYAAGFALKKYVKEFWSPFFPTFKGPTATSTEVRLNRSRKCEEALTRYTTTGQGRDSLSHFCWVVGSSQEDAPRLRESTHLPSQVALASLTYLLLRYTTPKQAVIISDIAHPDWPDDWPTLMSQLLALVGPSSSPDAVDGGMRVLLDFVGIDLTEDQLLPIAREMLPQLLTILGSPQVSFSVFPLLALC